MKNSLRQWVGISKMRVGTVSAVLTLAVVLLLVVVTAPLAHASKFTTLYNFTGGADGGYPEEGGLVQDQAGSLYGTTYLGGTSGYGTVFKVTLSGTETVLHSFTGGA